MALTCGAAAGGELASGGASMSADPLLVKTLLQRDPPGIVLSQTRSAGVGACAVLMVRALLRRRPGEAAVLAVLVTPADCLRGAEEAAALHRSKALKTEEKQRTQHSKVPNEAHMYACAERLCKVSNAFTAGIILMLCFLLAPGCWPGRHSGQLDCQPCPWNHCIKKCTFPKGHLPAPSAAAVASKLIVWAVCFCAFVQLGWAQGSCEV